MKYPEIEVQLTGEDGNAFAIMGAVAAGLKRAGVARSEVAQYRAEAMMGDYNNLLRVSMEWVNVQ